MAKTATPKRPTRKQLVGRARENYYNRVILIGTAILVALVLILVSWTWIKAAFISPNQTVVVVEGKEIKGQEFQADAKLNRQQLINSYLQTYNTYYYLQQVFGDNASLQSQYGSALTQIQAQLDPQTVGQFTVNQIVDDELLKLAAADLGITVSDEEVDHRLEEVFNYYPNGTPTPVITPTDLPTSTLSPAQYALVSVTPTWTPVPTETLEAGATEVPPTATATVGDSPTPEPTATEYTYEGFQQDLSSYYSNVETNLGMTQQQLRDQIAVLLIREKVKDYITTDLPHTQEMVWARHILVATEEEAQAALADLAAGKDFGTLASEISIDTGSKDKGGDLGWFTHDQMVSEFADAAFSMSIGETSEPIQSQFGWHIIQVLGHEDRPLTEDDYQQLRETKITDYIAGLRDKYQWEIRDGWQDMVPDTPTIPQEYLLNQ